MINKKIKVAARNSNLSLQQVKELFSKLPDIKYDLISMLSTGDKHKDISLMDNIADDFFTRELDIAIQQKQADIAVHSAKDLPYPLPAGLELYCLTEAVDKTDSLVSKSGLSLENLPEGTRVGTSSLKRKEELLRLRPDLEIVSIRGTIEERIAQVDSGYVDALIVATCALKRLGLEHRIAGILPFKTHPLQGNLAVTGRIHNPEIKELFSSLDIRKSYGKVTLAGFGPGNPDLLTIGADKALRSADIIVYDFLVNYDFLSRYKAGKVFAGKKSGMHHTSQDEINELLYQEAIAGKQVVRLKGGDPMIFARGREEIDYLQRRFVEVEVIPGISSGISLSSYTHIPLTHRGMASSVAFVTGHQLNSLQTPDTDTVVYYMAGNNISSIAKRMIAGGRDKHTPVALVYNVSLPGQQTFFSSLEELQYSVIKYPTPVLMVAGEVVSLENGKKEQKILVTGTSGNEYKEYEKSAVVVHTPLIKLTGTDSKSHFEALKEGFRKYDWIIFTSRYGVRFFFEIILELKLDIRLFASVKIASVGKTTSAELNKHYISPDIESSTESAEGIVEYFKAQNIAGKEILLPRSEIGLKYLPDELLKLNNNVTDLPVYKNEVNTEAVKQDLSVFSKIFFSSPSGVEAFKKIYGELPVGIPLIAKGKSTENKIIEEI